jgi:hypothetical protein
MYGVDVEKKRKEKAKRKKEKKGQQSWYLVDTSGHKNCQ